MHANKFFNRADICAVLMYCCNCVFDMFSKFRNIILFSWLYLLTISCLVAVSNAVDSVITVLRDATGIILIRLIVEYAAKLIANLCKQHILFLLPSTRGDCAAMPPPI